MIQRSRKYITVILSLLLLTGCYGGKMIKMPINAELAYRQVDTLRARQETIARLLNELSAQLRQDREENLVRRAETQTTLREIEASLEVLSNKIEANTQLLASLRGFEPNWNSVDSPASPRDTVQEDSFNSHRPDTLSIPPQVGGSEADRLFSTAYMDLTLGNYDLAIQGFKNYLMRFPGGAKLAEVHYYLGESYYASERHLEAVGEFQYILREFPDSRLVPAAFLKSGICYMNLEEYTLAEKTFRELISRHPDSEEAERARVALREMEG